MGVAGFVEKLLKTVGSCQASSKIGFVGIGWMATIGSRGYCSGLTWKPRVFHAMKWASLEVPGIGEKSRTSIVFNWLRWKEAVGCEKSLTSSTYESSVLGSSGAR